MRIRIEPYDALWRSLFNELKAELEDRLRVLNPTVEHIGSTSVEGLPSKPVVDIMVGIVKHDLDKTPELLDANHYLYIKAFNAAIPDRRFFFRRRVPGAPAVIDSVDQLTPSLNDNKVAHIHIVSFRGDFWIRHLAFRDYLRCHPEVCAEYGALKLRLSEADWSDSLAFNRAKEGFIAEHERKALEWHEKRAVDNHSL